MISETTISAPFFLLLFFLWFDSRKYWPAMFQQTKKKVEIAPLQMRANKKNEKKNANHMPQMNFSCQFSVNPDKLSRMQWHEFILWLPYLFAASPVNNAKYLFTLKHIMANPLPVDDYKAANITIQTSDHLIAQWGQLGSIIHPAKSINFNETKKKYLQIKQILQATSKIFSFFSVPVSHSKKKKKKTSVTRRRQKVDVQLSYLQILYCVYWLHQKVSSIYNRKQFNWSANKMLEFSGNSQKCTKRI